MKILLLFCLILLSTLLCCKRDNNGLDVRTLEAQKIAGLKDQFHGKYGIVSSISSEAVDINMDGIASTNLFEEIDILPAEKNYHFDVEVRIYDANRFSDGPTYLFNQAWPEQYIRLDNKDWTGGPGLNYDPLLRVDYVLQGTSRQFKFSKDMKLLNVFAGDKENPYRWIMPKSIQVSEAGKLIVVNKRYLYTKQGVKEVSVTSVYERFTKES